MSRGPFEPIPGLDRWLDPPDDELEPVEDPVDPYDDWKERNG